MTTERAHLLVAHRYFWPENISTYPLMLKDIVEHHAAIGHDVTIVTAAALSPQQAAERHIWADEQGVALHELDLQVDRGRSGAHRIKTALRFSVKATRMVLSGSYSHCSIASYPFLVAPALFLPAARLRKVRSLFYVQDIVSERMRRRGGLVGLGGRLAQLFERRFVAIATLTVTLTEDMKKTLGGGEIAVLQNFFTSADPSARAVSPPADAGPEFIYAGNLGRAQNLPFLLEAAALAAERRTFRVRLLGSGSEQEHLRELVAARGYTFAQVDDAVPRDQADQIIGDAQVGIVASEPHLFRSAFPSKTLSYLREGLAVLLICEPDVLSAQELVAAGMAQVGSPQDPSSLADAIIAMVDAHNAGTLERSAIAEWAVRQFSKDQYLARYERDVVSSWFLDRKRLADVSTDTSS